MTTRSLGKSSASLGAFLVSGIALMACVQVLGLDPPTIRARDGGAGGDGGGPCSVVSPNAQSVKACVMAQGCSAFLPSVSLGTCIALDQRTVSGRIDCLRSATACSDVLACVGEARAEIDQCPPGAPAASCKGTGNIGVECGNRKSAIDCNVRGGVCTTYASTKGGAVDRVGCDVELDAECTGTASACSGSKAYECQNGKGVGVDCAKSNGTCGVDEDGWFCAAKNPKCTDKGVTCEGDSLILCGTSGRVEFDCSKSGLTCAKSDDGTFGCLAPGCTLANDAACEEECVDATVVACVGGVRYPIDCTQYGFSSCQKFADKDGNPFAICQ